MNKTYIVRLTEDEREMLTQMVSKGKAAAYKIKHANILLAVDADGPGNSDKAAAAMFSCHSNTVRNVRQRFVENGLENALARKTRDAPPREKILDGAREARLIALACSESPEGRSRWTLELLADELVELGVVDAISPSTVCRTLKKTNCVLTDESAG